MQTELPQSFLATEDGARADAILRSCVHCGFCNATCPTYQELGDELDGPRGRIYLIKEMLESQQVDRVAVKHLDRCLTCRACETTCPSGVAYGELLEIGREFSESESRRGLVASWQRLWLLWVVPRPRRLRRWIRLGRLFRWALPRRLKQQLPRLSRVRRESVADQDIENRSRQVLVLGGCVQRSATPQVNVDLTHLLDRYGVKALGDLDEGCCGSLALHLGKGQDARDAMRRLLDVVAPHLDAVEAVISTASGCGVTLKEYPRLLAGDPDYEALAQSFAAKVTDAVEFVGGLADERSLRCLPGIKRVAVQTPCSLAHGQRLPGRIEALLQGAGYELVDVRDGHLCCGSAGTYSLLQPEISETLRMHKLEALTTNHPDVIATANVGCQSHLSATSPVPVRHWLELVT